MSYRLIGLLGGHRQVWPLEDNPGVAVLEIGRSSRCAISLPDGTVSKSHAEMSHANGAWQVRDLGSRNGTRVNGVPVTGIMTLKSGDQIEFGHVVLELTTEDVLSSTMTPQSSSDVKPRCAFPPILTGSCPAA
jgi:pSer/pThr/pTyr-binding forkhead associated (FHA) protein